MSTSRIFRWTVLAAVLAAMAPAPASAQLGRFIKSRLREKIAQVVVETVALGDSSVTSAPRGAAAESARPRSGPVFTESVLEMSPTLLVQFEKGLVAEIAERQAIASLTPQNRAQFAERQAQAIRKASGLTPRQYEILKERIVPFCTLGVSTAGHSVPHVSQGGAFLVYSVKELMSLGPYCPKLLLSLKALS